MSHRQAVGVMVLAALMWSMAGIVTRQVEAAQGLELTFWRSSFNAVALVLILSWRQSPSAVLRGLREGGPLLWASGVCWAVMFTAFMWALSLTTVANVLVTMAVAPLLTALLAWWWIGQRLAVRTVWAIAVAGVGMVIMQAPGLWEQGGFGVQGASGLGSGLGAHAGGTLLALAVPLAAAVNWVLIRRHGHGQGADQRPDFLLAVLVGALISSALTAVFAWPWRATPGDLGWMALLGVFQLAIPCLMAVSAARVLQPSEVALLSLLEVIFGVIWAWWGTQEAPSVPVVVGGALVIGTLVAHEGWPARPANGAAPPAVGA